MEKDKMFLHNKIIEIKSDILQYGVCFKPRLTEDKEYIQIKECVDIVGIDRISILFFDGCYNWNCGKPCKFCDLHPKEKKERSIRPNVNDIRKYNSIKEWWDFSKDVYFQGIRKSMKEILENIKNKDSKYQDENIIFDKNHIFKIATL